MSSFVSNPGWKESEGRGERESEGEGGMGGEVEARRERNMLFLRHMKLKIFAVDSFSGSIELQKSQNENNFLKINC